MFGSTRFTKESVISQWDLISPLKSIQILIEAEVLIVLIFLLDFLEIDPVPIVALITTLYFVYQTFYFANVFVRDGHKVDASRILVGLLGVILISILLIADGIVAGISLLILIASIVVSAHIIQIDSTTTLAGESPGPIHSSVSTLGRSGLCFLIAGVIFYQYSHNLATVIGLTSFLFIAIFAITYTALKYFGDYERIATAWNDHRYWALFLHLIRIDIYGAASSWKNTLLAWVTRYDLGRQLISPGISLGETKRGLVSDLLSRNELLLIITAFVITFGSHILGFGSPSKVVVAPYLATATTVFYEDTIDDLTPGTPAWFDQFRIITSLYVGIVPVYFYPDIWLGQISLYPFAAITILYIILNGGEAKGLLLSFLGLLTIQTVFVLKMVGAYFFGSGSEISFLSAVFLLVVEAVWVTGWIITVFGFTRSIRQSLYPSLCSILGAGLMATGTSFFKIIGGLISSNILSNQWLSIWRWGFALLFLNGFLLFVYGRSFIWRESGGLRLIVSGIGIVIVARAVQWAYDVVADLEQLYSNFEIIVVALFVIGYYSFLQIIYGVGKSVRKSLQSNQI